MKMANIRFPIKMSGNRWLQRDTVKRSGSRAPRLPRFEALQPGSALAADDPGSYDDNGRVKTTRTYNKGDLTRQVGVMDM